MTETSNVKSFNISMSIYRNFAGCEKLSDKGQCVSINETYEYQGWMVKCLREGQHFLTIPVKQLEIGTSH